MKGDDEMGNASEIVIREATELDRESIQTLLVDAYQQYNVTLPPERWEQYRQNIIASVNGDGPAARIVAVYKDEIVGSVLLFLSSEAAYGAPELEIHSPILRLLAVSPKARGLGVGTTLIQEVARRSLVLGASTLHLHTSDMMAAAVKLYERLGFERAFDKDIQNGELLVKSYKLHLKEAVILS
jgi:GNAT superfamily N-acetyltransferase